MKKIVFISVVIFTGLMVLSCGKESSCFKGTGAIVYEDRAIDSGILRVTVSDNIDLILTQNSKASLTLKGGENILPYIQTGFNGTELKLYSDNKCGFFRDYNKRPVAHLQLPNLEHLILEGQGNVTCTNTLNFSTFLIEAFNATGSVQLTLNSTDLNVKQHTGPADFNLSGNTDWFYVYTGGNGWLKGINLEASQVHVNHDGSGDVQVKANNTLLVELYSLGNLDYYGNPVVTVSSHTGSGEIRKK